MRTVTTFFLASMMALTLAACSTREGGSSDSSSDGSSSEVAIEGTAGYIVETAELDANASPENYPLIASDDFESAFDTLKAANLARELTDYQSVADIFGAGGAYYVNNDLELDGQTFKYYGWYSDSGVSVLITFKADGENLSYYAYTGNGIS